MTARAVFFSRRRGACPGLSAPMQTGDGLLVRLQPTGIISLAAFIALCAGARRDGNGIVEVTGRSSIQIRGLSVESAPRFADSVASLAIAAMDGVSVLANPLAGLDPAEIVDAGALAADIRRTAAGAGLGARLAPKVSVTVDGGSTLTLDDVVADVRLRAECVDGAVGLRVSLGGDGANATQLGTVAPADGVEAVIRLLEMIAQHGHAARARDILATRGTASLRSAIAGLLTAAALPSTTREASAVINTYRLCDGSLACGIGLPFGHADAAILERLAASAATAGATGICTAGRALLIVGLAERAMPEFVRDAERLGFIVDAGDPRRRVIACSGAPICASGYVATRALAQAIADGAAPSPHGTLIHVSGCAKGCAYSGKATLTVVGTPAGCALIAAGSVSDAPFAMVTAEDLPAAVTRYVRDSCREDSHV
ncbi:MAG TPA: precorrin-3B synthase [Xanthobacteraceae bacterium]|nr:precorrin-3B synthase [Xanthobacteraceae bacterium]